jgi:acyl-CoA thioester hydrolase
MPRIKLSLPEHLPFSWRVNVRVTDVNYGNHLGNDSVLGLVHEARVQFLRSLGYTEGNIEGASIVLSDAVVVFRAQAHLGDELEVHVGFGEVGRVECDMFYRLLRIADGKLIAEAKTNIVFMDAARTRPALVPSNFRQRIMLP